MTNKKKNTDSQQLKNIRIAMKKLRPFFIPVPVQLDQFGLERAIDCLGDSLKHRVPRTVTESISAAVFYLYLQMLMGREFEPSEIIAYPVGSGYFSAMYWHGRREGCNAVIDFEKRSGKCFATTEVNRRSASGRPEQEYRLKTN